MPERVSGPPPSMLPGAALSSLAARFCWQGQHFRLWTVPERVSGPPHSMLPGAALSSFAARFCWQGSTPGSGRCPSAFRGPPPRCCQAQHFRASLEPRGSFLLAGAALQALDGARARFGAPPPRCRQAQHFRASLEPRNSFLLAGAALQALDGARARFSFAARFCWQGQHFRLWTVPERVSGPPPLDAARRSTFEPRLSLAARFCWQGQHFRLWTVPERVSGPPPLMLPGAALLSFAARFCWEGQHFRLWTVPERVSGPPPSMLPGAALLSLAARFWQGRLWTVPDAALSSLAARFCWQGQHFRLWTVPPARCCQAQHFGASRLVSAGRGSTSGSGRCPSAFRGAALLSLAARFCWQGQHFRLCTVPERVSGPPPSMLPGAALSSLFRASRLVSAGRGSTSGSGRCPSAFRGPPPRCCQAQHFRASLEPCGAPPLRSTFEPRGSFLLAGAALQALDGARARFGAPPWMLPGAALLSFAARFCWQGQHFRLWTVPERVSGPPPSMLPGAALGSLAARFCWQGQHFRLWTVPGPSAARRSTWESRGSFLLAGAALEALDGARARFGAPPLDAARRSTWEPRASFLLAGAALEVLDGARARFGAPLP